MKRFILKGLVILVLLGNVKSQEWEPDYFECLPRDDDAINCTVGAGSFAISLREELDYPFYLAKLKYNGQNEPTIKRFEIGDNNQLGAEFEKMEDGYWNIKIKNRQDYENPRQIMYSLEIYIREKDGEETAVRSLVITLQNIFDNDPEVHYLGPVPCEWEAYQSNVDTNCKIFVKDIDGLPNNDIKMYVEDKGKNELEHFNFTKIDNSETEYTVEYYLRIEKALDYDKKAWYDLRIFAEDVAKNKGNMSMTVYVKNVPHSPPRWINPLVTATFKEKQAIEFNVTAVGGDIGIEDIICYYLVFPYGDYTELMEIDKDSGTLKVHPIDRDARKQEIYKFEICAEICNNPEMKTSNLTVLIVEDVNDNSPKITIEPNVIRIYENFTQEINLNKFDVSDIDLGEHAMYDIRLESAEQAFSIVPTSGYQDASFQLTIKDKDFLDYENPTWREIDVKIFAQEKHNLSHTDEFTLKIELINWNDEPPYFIKDYSVELNETVEKGYLIENITALDRDIDDFVKYNILGSFYGVAIDKENGTVYTSENDVFDYDRQKTVIIQVQATDNLTTGFHAEKINSAFTQLTINVLDVNNKTPELRMPRIVANCTENSTDIGIITKEIKAIDPDTTANLVFEIDWEQTFATKTGRQADIKYYKECFIIEPHNETNNEVYGYLKLNPEPTATIVDYEEYDTMHLFIKVTDLNQVVNEPSSNATLTIIIDDINDCAPEFIYNTITKVNTLDESRMVMEEAMENSLAGGSIQARDRDGPGNNNIIYSIIPIKDTNDTWIKIDNITGVLTVSENVKIDCDEPLIYGLYYEVQITDGLFTTVGEITINVTDINNKVPQFRDFNKTVEILEKSKTGTYIGTIEGYDKDRDEPHNVLEYTINYNIHKELQKFFIVDRLSGVINVSVQDGYELNRDIGPTQYMVNVDVKDNYLDSKSETRNSESSGILVILLDINDCAPEMPSPEDFKPEWFENAVKDDVLEKYTLVAHDNDQPNHPNSWVSFEILDINKGDGCNPSIEDYKDLFTMIGNHEESKGQFVANKDLKGYYGVWKIFIKAYDHGEPQQSSNQTFELKVDPFNYHTPEIKFPSDRAIRLRHDQSSLDGPLKIPDNTELTPFEAYDPDGGKYGNVTFEIVTETEYFIIRYINRSHSNLALKKKVEVGEYTLNIRAKDGGDLSTNQHVNIFIVDMNGHPYFEEEGPFSTNFTEGEKGFLEEYRILPEAKDPKNDGITNEDEKIKIYYYLDKNHNPNVTEIFSLDKDQRNLTLVKPLNRSLGKELFIKVIATNDKEESKSISEKSELLVRIKVKDANPKPEFDDTSKKYYCSITVHDENKVILRVHANDSDIENSNTTYHIKGPIQAHGTNIEKIKDTIFKLNSISGELTVQNKIDSSMTGYFEFNITAEDDYGNNDEANVKVYILADSNRISFTFLSNLSLIKENVPFLQDVLSKEYKYDKCSIDDIFNSTETNEDGTTSKYVKVVFHFIHNNKPVDGAEVLQKTNQQLTENLKQSFIQKRILLHKILNAENTQAKKIEETGSTALIIIAIILGVLCGLLVVAFVLKTKALKRQIKAFAPPEFGSRASDLNRIGVPTTNVFSVEGSNPVINDNNIKEEFDDASSIDSDGSDFVGINNDVNFMMKSESVGSKNSSVILQYGNHKENINQRNSFEDNEEKVMRF